jgi:uncharacterized protein YndB with AHSA1/START domain
MGPASAEIDIDVPRRRIFEELLDLSRRPAFTDHFISDFRLTRIDPTGLGAGARFRFQSPLRSPWVDTMIVEVEEPHLIVEEGRGGRVNRIPSHTVWELLEGPGPLSRVRVSHWTEPANAVDRTVEVLSGASIWSERGWREALRRLRDQLESEAQTLKRIAVAGGNPHPTGIP